MHKGHDGTINTHWKVFHIFFIKKQIFYLVLDFFSQTTFSLFTVKKKSYYNILAKKYVKKVRNSNMQHENTKTKPSFFSAIIPKLPLLFLVFPNGHWWVLYWRWVQNLSFSFVKFLRKPARKSEKKWLLWKSYMY